jgi:DNA polymerase beta
MFLTIELTFLWSRLKSGDEAKKLPGVGEKIAKKIEEILSTGHLEKLDKIRKDDSSVAINHLSRVFGIGRRLCFDFRAKKRHLLDQLSLSESKHLVPRPCVPVLI